MGRAVATPEHVAWAVGRAAERKRLNERVRRLERRLDNQDRSGEIVGASRAMDRVFELAHGAAAASSPLLLVGESGTGKEMLARAVHRQGRRGSGPFVVVDCAALPADRIDQEIFGGLAGSARPIIRSADGGTLFLADVGTLPPCSQAKLVQLFQRGEIPVDQDRPPLPVDVRVIAASCEELKPLVDAGTLRRDLLLPLQRDDDPDPSTSPSQDDIPLLSYHFLHRHAQRLGRSMQRISPEALRLLREHRWTGNVRELDHAIERGRCPGSWRRRCCPPTLLSFVVSKRLRTLCRGAIREKRSSTGRCSTCPLPRPRSKRSWLRTSLRGRVDEAHGQQRVRGCSAGGIGPLQLPSDDETGSLRGLQRWVLIAGVHEPAAVVCGRSLSSSRLQVAEAVLGLRQGGRPRSDRTTTVTRRETLTFHLCPTCSLTYGRARRLARASKAMLAAGVLVSLLLVIANGLVGFGVLAVGLLLFALINWRSNRSRAVKAKRIALSDGSAIRIENVGLSSVDDWPGAQGRAYRVVPKRCPHCDFMASEFRQIGDASVCPSCGRSFG